MQENILLITLDSCRWDVFLKANTPNFNKLGAFKKAYSHATYTLPSHISIFSGLLPHCFEKLPFYNRFERGLFRICERSINSKAHIEFPSGTKNIIEGLKRKGYETLGTGAMSWFKNPILTHSFDSFFFSGISIEKQINFILDKRNNDIPNFLFINIGETHEPYEVGTDILEKNQLRSNMRAFSNIGFLQEYFDMQINCVEYLDTKIKKLVEQIIQESKRDLLLIICADHGECFGEDGLYGHGFYHPKVMEVPLCISQIPYIAT